jgi:hypothetical protein
VPAPIIEDVRSLDPVSYIRTLGLRPEDSYGFIPTKLDEGSEFLYLYRDRPEYEHARSTGSFVPRVAMQIPATSGGMLGGIVEQAQELQRMYGGGQAGSIGAPGDPMPATPDVEKLVEAAKMRSSGAIDDTEYARLRAEAGVPDPGAPPSEPPAPTDGDGPAIVAHRMYPDLRARSSTQQLDRFLPSYCEALGLRPEDVYGVFPWQTRTSSGDGDSSTEWDDYWIVYRDRPEYAAARDAYAREMDEKGRWPEPVTAPGVGEASEAAAAGGEVQVENDLWPRALLVVKQTGGQLADSLKEKIAARGYEPEDSFGFCPSFTQRSIYFGWRAHSGVGEGL